MNKNILGDLLERADNHKRLEIALRKNIHKVVRQGKG